ncbi:MAG: hypothetical protein AB7E60_12380 [Sphingobium sp.]
MLKLDESKTQAVAAQTTQAFASFDSAIVDTARLTTAFLAAADGSGMTASESQRIIQRIHESAARIIAGRSEMVRATALLTQAVENSWFDFSVLGCPRGMADRSEEEATSHLTLVA